VMIHGGTVLWSTAIIARGQQALPALQALLALPLGKEPQVPIIYQAERATESASGCGVKQKNPCLCEESNWSA
jgi:hypothetical protein